MVAVLLGLGATLPHASFRDEPYFDIIVDIIAGRFFCVVL